MKTIPLHNGYAQSVKSKLTNNKSNPQNSRYIESDMVNRRNGNKYIKRSKRIYK